MEGKAAQRAVLKTQPVRPYPPEPPKGPGHVFTVLHLWTYMCLVHMHMGVPDAYLLTKAASACLQVSEVCDHACLSSAPVSDCGYLCISGSLCILLLWCSVPCLDACVGVHLHTCVCLCVAIMYTACPCLCFSVPMCLHL